MKQVEQVVRQLIVLLATRLHIVFAPLKARGPKIVADLPDGVELVIADRDFTVATIAAPTVEAEEAEAEAEAEAEEAAEAPAEEPAPPAEDGEPEESA